MPSSSTDELFKELTKSYPTQTTHKTATPSHDKPLPGSPSSPPPAVPAKDTPPGTPSWPWKAEHTYPGAELTNQGPIQSFTSLRLIDAFQYALLKVLAVHIQSAKGYGVAARSADIISSPVAKFALSKITHHLLRLDGYRGTASKLAWELLSAAVMPIPDDAKVKGFYEFFQTVLNVMKTELEGNTNDKEDVEGVRWVKTWVDVDLREKFEEEQGELGMAFK